MNAEGVAWFAPHGRADGGSAKTDEYFGYKYINARIYLQGDLFDRVLTSSLGLYPFHRCRFSSCSNYISVLCLRDPSSFFISSRFLSRLLSIPLFPSVMFFNSVFISS